MKIFRGSQQQGFSLVELMVVVGIIGILATLAMPRFKQFQAKAKMSEAKTMVGHIYSLQQSYYLDQNIYASLADYGAADAPTGACVGTATPNDIGFSIEPCGGVVPRYQYSAGIFNGGTQFTAVAKTFAGANNRVCPGNVAHFYATDEKNQTAATGTPIVNTAAIPSSQVREQGVGVLCPN